jgi:phage tail-like protein
MPTPTRVDPYKNFNFRVEIAGSAVAGFSECSGLTSEIDVVEYREGQDGTVRKLPGLVKFSDITLKRGITVSNDLQNWFSNILNGQSDRRNGAVILLDDQNNEVVRWSFSGAFPRKLEGPHLRAGGSEVAIETIVLAVERLDWGS